MFMNLLKLDNMIGVPVETQHSQFQFVVQPFRREVFGVSEFLQDLFLGFQTDFPHIAGHIPDRTTRLPEGLAMADQAIDSIGTFRVPPAHADDHVPVQHQARVHFGVHRIGAMGHSFYVLVFCVERFFSFSKNPQYSVVVAA
jgi:hypothetical protein